MLVFLTTLNIGIPPDTKTNSRLNETTSFLGKAQIAHNFFDQGIFLRQL